MHSSSTKWQRRCPPRASGRAAQSPLWNMEPQLTLMSAVRNERMAQCNPHPRTTALILGLLASSLYVLLGFVWRELSRSTSRRSLAGGGSLCCPVPQSLSCPATRRTAQAGCRGRLEVGHQAFLDIRKEIHTGAATGLQPWARLKLTSAPRPRVRGSTASSLQSSCHAMKLKRRVRRFRPRWPARSCPPLSRRKTNALRGRFC